MGCNCGKKRVYYISSDDHSQDMSEYIVNILGNKINPIRITRMSDVRFIPPKGRLFIQAFGIFGIIPETNADITQVFESDLS